MSSSQFSMWMEETPRWEGAPNTTPTRISTVRFDLPITGGRVAAEPQRRSRDNELRGNLSPTATIIEGYAPAGSVNVGGYMNDGIPLCRVSGLVMTATQGDGVNEIQTVTKNGTVTGGTWGVTILSTLVVTGLAFDATAATVQAAIDDKIRRMMGAAPVKLGDILVGGGPVSSTPMTFTYRATVGCQNVAQLTTASGSLVGGGTYDAATSQAGSVGTVLLPDGRGIPATVYRWLSSKETGTTAKTAQVLAAYAESSGFEMGQGFAASSLVLDDAGSWAATMLGLVAGGAADPGITPVYDSPAVEPLMARDRIVTWQTGSGNISTFGLTITNPVTASRHHGIRSAFPGKMRYSEGFVTATGSVGMDEFDTSDRDAFNEAQTFAVQSHWQTRSQIASTGALYEMFFSAPACQLIDGPGVEDLAAKRRHEASYSWGAFYDPTATHPNGTTGYDFALCFTSGLSTLETFV